MAFETLSFNLISEREVPVEPFSWPIWLDKRAWDLNQLLNDHSADLIKFRGEIDLLAGGPPCQGFSFAGRRNEHDPRNQLFEAYVEVVQLLRPKMLLLENVPGMRVGHIDRNVINLTPTRERTRSKSFYERLAEKLDGVGYEVEARLVDASAFGVPQRRSRLIALGIKKGISRADPDVLSRAFELVEEERVHQLTELGLEARVSALDAISDLEVSRAGQTACLDPASPAGFREGIYLGPQSHYQELMQDGFSGSMDSMRIANHSAKVSGRFSEILSTCKKGVRMDDESRRRYGLRKHRIFPMAPLEPAPTVTTLPDDVLHYSEPRILTVRESARLQSFPDWFMFRGKYTTGGDRRGKECPRYTQVGNAVPPLLARAVGLGAKRLLEDLERREIGTEIVEDLARTG